MPKPDPICARIGCNEPLSEHNTNGCKGSTHPETKNRLVCAVMCTEFLTEAPKPADAPSAEVSQKYLKAQEDERTKIKKIHDVPDLEIVYPDEKAIAREQAAAKK